MNLLLSLVVLAACRRSGPDWRIVQLYAGETTIELLQHPAKVQAFRVDDAPRAVASGGTHAGPFAATGAVVELSAEDAAEMSKILADPDSYDWRRGAKREAFRPQIGLSFVRGPYVLAVAVDLASAQVDVHAGDQHLGMYAVDAAQSRLVALAKRAFPDDPVIGALR